MLWVIVGSGRELGPWPSVCVVQTQSGQGWKDLQSPISCPEAVFPLCSDLQKKLTYSNVFQISVSQPGVIVHPRDIWQCLEAILVIKTGESGYRHLIGGGQGCR